MNIYTHICENCNKEHDGTYGSGRFCSRSCANSRVITKEIKEKISNSAKNSEKVLLANKSRKLSQLKIEQRFYGNLLLKLFNKKKKRGGYRKNSGRSKSGYYEGIYCGSTYELCWVIYNLDHNIQFKRFEGMLKGNGINYIPDFIQNDIIIEIKGYHTEQVDLKKKLVEDLGYKVCILYKNDLEYIFQYVKNKYNTSKFETLYDNYKPKYDFICNNCLKIFGRNSKPKTKEVFCCRKCAGIYRTKENFNYRPIVYVD